MTRLLVPAVAVLSILAAGVPFDFAQGWRFAAADDPHSQATYEVRVQSAVDAILANPDLPNAFWGLYAEDLQSGRIILSRNADKLFIPASNMKLLTTATALDVLGSDHRFTTNLYHIGDIRGDLMTGDLVIRGDGDPTFGSEWIEEDPLVRWADEIAALGVRRFEGRIIGDDNRFEDNPYAEGWDVSHIGTESYAPPAGGLAWSDNLFTIAFDGAREQPELPGILEIQNDLRADGGSEMDIYRPIGTNRLTLQGSVPPGFRDSLVIPVPNATTYAASALADRLRAAGITVEARIEDVDDLQRTPRYDGQQPLRSYVSPPLSEIVGRVNRESDNFYAEQLIRSLTPEGSVQVGTAIVKDFLARSGAKNVEAINLVDGSGLARKNLVTPQSMAAVLRTMRTHPAGEIFRNSLPTGGEAQSTLRSRLQGIPVRAKTGSLDYVRALSGYVTGPEGQPIVFVVFANNYTTQSGVVFNATNQIIEALATGRRPSVSEE